MSTVFADVQPGTDEQRRQIAGLVYGPAIARRAIQDAEYIRALEHCEQFEAFRDVIEAEWRDHPGPEGLTRAWQRLEQFGAAWDATDARYLAALDAAVRNLNPQGGAVDADLYDFEPATWCNGCHRMVLMPEAHRCDARPQSKNEEVPGGQA